MEYIPASNFAQRSGRGREALNPTSMQLAYALVLLCIGYADARTSGDNPSFMMVSGITSESEMCLTVANGAPTVLPCAACGLFLRCAGNVEIEGVDVVLESCAAAIAAGDGREIW